MGFWSRLRGTTPNIKMATFATFTLLGAGLLLQPDTADAVRDERTLSLYEIHLRETTTVTFKRDGRYLPEGLKKLNHAMRDWRTGATTKMDPKLFDLVWELHKQLGSKKPVHVISGHRSAKTNRKLRKRGGGQAKKSQHVRGRAMDIHFPDVSMSKVRKAAFVHEVGGVGYYPTSALPFVHVDTARVRSWPRMSRRQLAMLFPHGTTKHRPSSGGPLNSRDRKKARVRLAMLARKTKTSTLLAHASIPAAILSPAKGMKAPAPVPAIVVASLEKNKLPAASGLSRHASRLWINKPGSLALPAPRPAPRLASAKPAQSPFIKQLLNNGRGTAQTSKPPKSRIQLASLAPQDAVRALPPRSKSNLWVDGAGQRSSWLTEQSQPKSLPKARRKPYKPALRKPELAALNTSTFKKTSKTTHQHFDAERVAYAPSFDAEHPDELSYRPFQILPLMSTKPIAQNTTLVAMVEPKYNLIHQLLLSSENIPMQFRPSSSEAGTMWNNQFKGNAIINIRKQAENRLLPTRPRRVAQR